MLADEDIHRCKGGFQVARVLDKNALRRRTTSGGSERGREGCGRRGGRRASAGGSGSSGGDGSGGRHGGGEHGALKGLLGA